MRLVSIQASWRFRPSGVLLTSLFMALPLLACQTAESRVDPVVPPADQLVSFTINGQSNDVNGDCVSGCIRGEFDEQFTLIVTAPGRQTLTMRIKEFTGKTGSFPFTTDDATIEYSSGPSNPVYATGYLSCQSPFNQVNPDGTLKVLKVAGKPGEYVEGSFATVLHPKGECGRGGLPINGLFRIKRER